MSQFAKETIPVSLEDEMKKSYLDYAMSVIVGRALPDVRDGLKPVHRRVLYVIITIDLTKNQRELLVTLSVSTTLMEILLSTTR